MTYQENDYIETDSAPWTATPARTDARLYPLTPNPLITTTNASPVVPINTQIPTMSDMIMLGSILQSVQQTQRQQTYLLRDFDARLARVESNGHPAAAATAASNPSFERATWWAIWGILMLVLGSALAIVIVLILMRVDFR